MGAMLRPMIDGMQNSMAGTVGANDPFTALAGGAVPTGEVIYMAIYGLVSV